MSKYTITRAAQEVRMYQAAVEEEIGRALYYANKGEYVLSPARREAMARFLEAAQEARDAFSGLTINAAGEAVETVVPH